MYGSDLPCEFCENDEPDSQYISDGKREYRLCHDCHMEYEEKLGYSHRYKADHCPTCHHLRGLRIVKYKKDDPGVKQCSDCGGYYSFLNNDGRCEECWDAARIKQPGQVEEERSSYQQDGQSAGGRPKQGNVLIAIGRRNPRRCSSLKK